MRRSVNLVERLGPQTPQGVQQKPVMFAGRRTQHSRYETESLRRVRRIQNANQDAEVTHIAGRVDGKQSRATV